MKIMCRMSLDAAGKALDFEFPLTDYNFLRKAYDNQRFDRALGIQPWFSVTTATIKTAPEARSLPEAIAATDALLAAIQADREFPDLKQVIWPALLPELLCFLEGVGPNTINVKHTTRGKLWSEIMLDTSARPPHEQDEVLFEAVFNKNLVAVSSSIAKGASPNLTDATGTSVLARASADCPEMIGVLVEAGADPNGRFTFRSSVTKIVRADQVALMSAGSAEAVRTLAECGADVDAQDAGGNTALMWTVHWGQADVVAALLAAGADNSIRRHKAPKRRVFTATEIAREMLDDYRVANPKHYKPGYLEQTCARYERILKLLA